MYNLTHFFEIDGNKYALDHRNLFFCLLDEDTESALKQGLSGDTLSQSEHSSAPTIEALIKSGYFISHYPDNPVPNFEYTTLNISFAPVHDCNFACKYCYAKAGEGTHTYQQNFDESKIDRLLEYIHLDKYSHFQNYKFDFVSGGEPLLNFPILEYFLKKARYFDNIHNKKTAVLIVTNGTLLTTENIKTMDEYDVFLGISIDGSEEIHNHHRVYKNGCGTFMDVSNGISSLKTSNASSKLKDAWAMTVITKDTGSLVDVMETCISLGFKRMQMQLVRESSNHPLAFNKSDLPTLKEHYKNLFSHMLDCAKQGDLSRIKMIANDNDSFGKYLARLLLRLPVFYRCFAGKNKISVNANGEIYPCDSFCGTKDFCMGTLDDSENDDTIVNIFQQAHIQNRKQCSKCWAKHICGGDCFYNSYLANGNIYDPDPIICEMNRFFIEHAIDLLIKLQEMDINHIEYFAKFLRLR